MPFPPDPHDRSPKGDHNRRLALGMDIDDFANAANLTPGEVHKYGMTDVDGQFDLEVAQKFGAALERLEATLVPKVDNGGVPRV